jgi:predicted nucleic acid-binding protein
VIVIDASVVTDWLLHGRTIVPALRGSRRQRLAAPHLLDAEVTHALRRQVLTGRMAAQRAHAALRILMASPIMRFPHTRLLSRALELRDNATAYDALYLALAEILEAPLLTRDTALAKVPGVRVPVEVLP